MDLGKTRHQEMVEEFMREAGQAMPIVPTTPDLDIRKLRARLILEEALETINRGLGFNLKTSDNNDLLLADIEFVEARRPSMIEIVDGCCDIAVVTTGTLSACGVKDWGPQYEVNSANLRKFGPGSYRREDGKWIKPPDFKPPDVYRTLQHQGWIEWC